MDGQVIEKHIGRYVISHFQRSLSEVVVVFVSSGGHKHEFKGSLRRFSLSVIFVYDQQASWFSAPEAPEVFEYVASIVAQYKKIAVMGESLGGAGAMLFPRFCPFVDRVLAFSPVYTFAYPYDFFLRGWTKEQYTPNFWSFHAPEAPCKSSTVLLFGLREWRDIPFAGLYKLNNYSVLFVKGAGHMVASSLKYGGNEDSLLALLEVFTDFSKRFDESAVSRLLSHRLGEYGYDDDDYLYENEGVRTSLRVKDAIFLPIKEGLLNLSQGRPASQSSLSEWSVGKTLEEDAARAVQENLPEFFAFHTDVENQPWWEVYLDEGAVVYEVRLFNRIDNTGCSERSLRFKIERYLKKEDRWEMIFEKANRDFFGGIDGKPFIWETPSGVEADKIRITSLEGYECLHLQHVDVLGRYRTL
ncbi:hypothetical protein NQF86_02945 [Bombella sp. TMW 2.2543]|uniref:F5/8 type C domain-containing protein n=1 Tax=Bombella pluederhausensis TaxID=2967336 RepID=A0ABT3WET7_9PROT|nr:hypothetical protein [Bombella pluederhausensis]MCX5617630.1 hypothetical protein [Bombella pluederhausensis]